MSDHAKSNARAWLNIICEQIEQLETFRDEREHEKADAIHETIQEAPLSLQVRGGWHSPGSEDDQPEEYEILLSTGGPALRIHGELDGGQPSTADLEWQDWGTPWTIYHEGSTEQDERLLTWAQTFYFGE